MARRAKPAAPEAAKSIAAAAAPAAPSPGAPALIETLRALAAAHGVALEIPPDEEMVPGAAIRLCVAGPHSIERFVEEARSHPHVREVQVLSTHIALEIVVPAEVEQ